MPVLAWCSFGVLRSQDGIHARARRRRTTGFVLSAGSNAQATSSRSKTPHHPCSYHPPAVSSEHRGDSRCTSPFWLCMGDRPLQLFDEWPCVVLSRAVRNRIECERGEICDSTSVPFPTLRFSVKIHSVTKRFRSISKCKVIIYVDFLSKRKLFTCPFLMFCVQLVTVILNLSVPIEFDDDS